MVDNNLKLGHGLIPHSEDTRDIQFGAVYTLPTLNELPPEFLVCDPIVIKNQKQTDRCTAYASTAVSEDQENKELSPEYQFYKAKHIQGDLDSWGCDLRSVALSLIKYGSLPAELCTFTADTSRATILSSESWSRSDDLTAEQYKKQSFMWVSGPYDFFDNCRATLWKNRGEKKSLLTGVIWCQQWTESLDGYITEPGTPGYGHAIKIYGWKLVKGEPILIAQLSNGKNIGDNGLFYFTREVINQCFTFGAITFTDMPKEKAQYLFENGIKKDDNWLIHIYKVLRNFLLNKK